MRRRLKWLFWFPVTVIPSLSIFLGFQGGLLIREITLLDGKTWRRGDGRKPEPFRLQLVLANVSTDPARLWDPLNSEGSRCSVVVLSGAGGRRLLLQPRSIERSAGVPTAVTLPPGGTLKIALNLTEMNAGEQILPGSYRLQVIYRNTLAQSGPVRQIWTGEVTSSSTEIRVVSQ